MDWFDAVLKVSSACFLTAQCLLNFTFHRRLNALEGMGRGRKLGELGRERGHGGNRPDGAGDGSVDGDGE